MDKVIIKSTANVCFGQTKTDIELISKSLKCIFIFIVDLRKAKCWRIINNLGNCEDNVNGDVTQEVCCQTLGKAWGSPCQRCPTTGKTIVSCIILLYHHATRLCG